MNIFSSGQDRVIAVCDSIALYTQIKMIKCSNSNWGKCLEALPWSAFLQRLYVKALLTWQICMLRVLGGIAVTLGNQVWTWRDLEETERWVESIKMKCENSKCRVVHLGSTSHPHISIEKGGLAVDVRKAWGVHMTVKSYVSRQSNFVATGS